MIKEGWRRIAGIHIQSDGQISAVWMAWDPDTDIVHIYDACNFRREVLAIIAEGLNSHGRGVPISWVDKDLSEKLDDRGCNMNPDKADDSESMTEMITRDIGGRMRSGRIKVGPELAEWLKEFETFNRKDSKVPRGTHPLMAATRHAMSQLEDARAEVTYRSTNKIFPQVAIV